ncbi:endonuclease/exonuclease/phosphatase [Roseibium sp. TrichSKD4]|uniref:endonuclease/exonuclease/phosphatase family protein n=1 Tax=Roseibium sp. TrichSKD4 TaxID=744980 RepID=UPI0001E568F3|nr:endonuclease/exonuclease/phosphatase family protein [Roseibium sp. TrichSKD4]EFO30578.1 endonuclease/exonuclease/phosphatase [Roseibium sp. TrichSKD4]
MSDYFLAFWNLENLFGPENHPHRLDWVKKDIASDLVGWTQALYDKKLAQLASIIRQMNDGAGPDILGVCEAEDEHVLKDLINTLAPSLPNRNYSVIAETNDLSYRGIDTAFIYDKGRFSVDEALVFNHRVMRRTGTRDILQVTFKTNQGRRELVAMANHWPSRYGGAGPEASAGFRATAGETLSYWHSRIFEEATKKDRTPVIAFGDMNDDPWDRSLTVNALATRERGDVERARSPKFYNLAWEYLVTPAIDHKGNSRMLEGTLYYNYNGNIFDHLLVNRPLVDANPDSEFKYVDGSGGIIAFPEMVSHRTGDGPIRFGLPEGDAASNVNEAGYSDHFPVGLKIREV